MAVNPLTGTAPKIVIEYDNPDVTVPYFAEPVDEKLKRELFTAAARVFGREPDNLFVTGFNLTLESASNPLTACEAQSDESTAEPEREAPAVCRWCKGTREITINHKTKPCEECAKDAYRRSVEKLADNDGRAMAFLMKDSSIGRGWKVRKEFGTVA